MKTDITKRIIVNIKIKQITILALLAVIAQLAYPSQVSEELNNRKQATKLLFNSCNTGNLEGVKKALGAGANYAAKLKGRMPLDIACERGDSKIVEYLLKTYAFRLHAKNECKCLDYLNRAIAQAETRLKDLKNSAQNNVSNELDRLSAKLAAYDVTKKQVFAWFSAICKALINKQNFRQARKFVHNGVSQECKQLFEQQLAALNNAMRGAAIKGDLKAVKGCLVKGASLTGRDSDGNSIFHYACASGDEALVAYLASLNDWFVVYTNNKGQTGLHIACSSGHLPLVKLIMSMKKSSLANWRDNDGNTPLHYASKDDNCLPIVQHLILSEPDASKNGINKRGNSAETTAFYADAVDIFAYYVEKWNMPYLEQIGTRGETFLHHAAFRGLPKMFDFLVAHKPALLAHRDQNGNTPLFEAIRGNALNIIQRCVDRYDLSVMGRTDRPAGALPGISELEEALAYAQSLAQSRNRSAIVTFLAKTLNNAKQLIEAIQLKDARALEIALKQGANPNGHCHQVPSLCIAIACNFIEGVKLLLEYHADTNNPTMYLPLCQAIESYASSPLKSTAIIELLLQHKALIDQQSNWSPRTPWQTFLLQGDPTLVQLFAKHKLLDPQKRPVNSLPIAAQFNNLHTIKALLDYHFDPNAQDENGYIAGHLVRSIEGAKLLLARGWNPALRGRSGYAASDVIVARLGLCEPEEMEKTLDLFEVVSGKSCDFAGIHQPIGRLVANRLLDLDPNALLGPNAESVAMAAIAVLRKLIVHGFSVNYHDPNNGKGDSALHFACSLIGSPSAHKFICFLLAHGADASLKNNKGKTPFLYAVSRASNNPSIPRSIIASLVEHGGIKEFQLLRKSSVLLQDPAFDVYDLGKALEQKNVPHIKKLLLVGLAPGEEECEEIVALRDLECINLVVKNYASAIKAKPRKHRSLFGLVYGSGLRQTAKQLLAYGMMPAETTGEVIIRQNDGEFIALMLENIAPYIPTDPNTYAPLVTAALETENYHLVKRLLFMGIMPRAEDCATIIREYDEECGMLAVSLWRKNVEQQPGFYESWLTIALGREFATLAEALRNLGVTAPGED